MFLSRSNAKIFILCINKGILVPNDIVLLFIQFSSFCLVMEEKFCIPPSKWTIPIFRSIHTNIKQRIIILLDNLIGPCNNMGLIDYKWTKHQKDMINLAQKNIKHYRSFTVNDKESLFLIYFNEVLKRSIIDNKLSFHATLYINWGEFTNILMNLGINFKIQEI